MEQAAGFEGFKQIPRRLSFDQHPLRKSNIAAGKLGELRLEPEALEVPWKGGPSFSMVNENEVLTPIDFVEVHNLPIGGVQDGFNRLHRDGLPLRRRLLLKGEQAGLFPVAQLVRAKGRGDLVVSNTFRCILFYRILRFGLCRTVAKNFCFEEHLGLDRFRVGLNGKGFQCVFVHHIGFVELFLPNQLDHQAVHVFLLSFRGFVDVGVPRVACDENMDGTGTLAGRSAPALNGTNGTWDGFVQHHQICSGHVQSLLPDRGCDQDVDLPAAKPVELRQLLLLCHPFLRPTGGLPDERIRFDAPVSVEQLDQAFH